MKQQIMETPNLQELVIKETLSLLNETSLETAMFVGREEEIKQLSEILQNAITKDEKQSHVIRLTGASGSGKTYTIMRLLSSFSQDIRLKHFMAPWWSAHSAVINGALIHNSAELLNSLINVLLPEENRSFVTNTSKALGLAEGLEALKHLRMQYVLKNPKNYQTIVVIDEEDQLLPYIGHQRLQKNKKSLESIKSILTVITNMASENYLNLVLVSNLTSCSQRLTRQTKKTSTSSIVFKPYTETQLKIILESKIELAKQNIISKLSSKKSSFNYKKFLNNALSLPEPFSSTAKTFILKRVASHHGDCRQMLEICRQLILEKLVDLNENNNFEKKTNSFELIEEKLKLVKRNVNNFVYNESSKNSNISICSETTAASSPRSFDYVKYDTDLQSINFLETTRLLNQKCYKKSKVSSSNLILNLPLYQQVLLCALCLTARQLETSEILNNNFKQYSFLSISALQKIYKNLCTQHQLPFQFRSQNDFMEGLSYLETTGIIKIHSKCKQNVGFRRPSTVSFFNEAEVELLLDLEDTLSVLKEAKQFFKGLLE